MISWYTKKNRLFSINAAHTRIFTTTPACTIKTLAFHVLYTNIGIDVRYNSEYVAPSYAGWFGAVFYNGGQRDLFRHTQ